MKKLICAIDFGTTHSTIGYYDHHLEKPVLIKQGKWALSPEQPYLLPSVVGYFYDRFEVGQIAINADLNYEHNVYHLKDLVGKNFHYHFYDQSGQSQQVDVLHLISIIFNHLKQQAQMQLHCQVEHLVLSVPAHFNQGQIDQVVAAAKLAKWNVLKVFFEPNCAASYYFYQNQTLKLQKDFKKTLIVDLGGGTLDLVIGTNYHQYFEATKIGGRLSLGGKDWDDVIAKWITEELKTKFDVVANQDLFLTRRILMVAKQIKERLSFQPNVDFSIKGLYDQNQTMIDAHLYLNRETLLKISTHLHDHFKLAISTLCANEIDSIDQILLVGGAMKMPTLQAIINQLFQKKPKLIANPELVVVYGMCYWLKDFWYLNQKMIIKPVLNLPIGIAINDDQFFVMIKANTSLPVSQTMVFQTNGVGQNLAQIKVAQGLNQQFSRNYHLGTYLIKDLQMANLQKNQIKITISVDQHYQAQLILENLQSGYLQKIDLKRPFTYLKSQFVIHKLAKQNQIYQTNLELLKAIDQQIEILNHQLNQLENDQFYLEISQQLISDTLVAIEQQDFTKLATLKTNLSEQIKANQAWLNHHQSVSD